MIVEENTAINPVVLPLLRLDVGPENEELNDEKRVSKSNARNQLIPRATPIERRMIAIHLIVEIRFLSILTFKAQ